MFVLLYSSYHLNLSFLHLVVFLTTLETPKNTSSDCASFAELRSQGRAMKPHIGSEVNCEFLFSRERSEMTCNVYEMIHIWTADIYEGDMWSSQWISNLSNWNEEAWKKSGLQRDSNPWPPRYRCDALPTELWSHTLGARSIVSSYFPVKGVKWCNVYEMIHIWTADIYEGDMWSHNWISSSSLPMCGFIAQLVEHRTGIAEVTGSNPVEALIFFFFFFFFFFFQASSFQLLKLEIHCEDHISPSYISAVHIWIIS